MHIKHVLKNLIKINYIFLNDMSQIKIPLLPLDCLHCQSAYQVNLNLTLLVFIFV